MCAMTLSPDRDPMGAAIADYLAYGKASKLRVISSQFDEDEIPVAQLFRAYEQMPEIERVALKRCNGRILDVGAGSGCHSLALQEQGADGHGHRYLSAFCGGDASARGERCAMCQSVRSDVYRSI